MHPHARFFSRKVGYMPLGTPCNHIMAIFDYSKATMAFIATAFQPYELPSIITATIPQNVRFNTASMS